jgi:hypothetical protein
MAGARSSPMGNSSRRAASVAKLVGEVAALNTGIRNIRLAEEPADFSDDALNRLVGELRVDRQAEDLPSHALGYT